jgi:hypothetical protein
MARGKRFVMWLIGDDKEIFAALKERYPSLKKAQIVRLALQTLLRGQS